MKSPRSGTYEVGFHAQNRAWAPLLRLLRSNLRPRIGVRWGTLGYVGLRWATLGLLYRARPRLLALSPATFGRELG